MIRRVLTAAILAGLLAGLVVSAAQRIAVIPMIGEFEALEAGAATAADDGHAGHDHAGPWAPQDGLERTAFTVLANVLTGVAFGLILAAAMVLRGRAIDWRRGLLWGLAGFAAFALLPGLGLPPEPPGMARSALADRQVWWLATAAASAGALALLVFGRAWLWRAAGLALLVAPHAIGAPRLEGSDGLFGLLAQGGPVAGFALASLATTLAFWLVLGAATGPLVTRAATADEAENRRYA
jgi:cobalt transporter subunit CbtA